MAEKKTEFLVLIALAVILIVGLVEFGERSPQHSTPPTTDTVRSPFTVLAAPLVGWYSLTPNNSVITVQAGAPVFPVPVTSTPHDGWTGDVGLIPQTSEPHITVSVAPTVIPRGSGSAIATVTVLAATPPGLYTIAIGPQGSMNYVTSALFRVAVTQAGLDCTPQIGQAPAPGCTPGWATRFYSCDSTHLCTPGPMPTTHGTPYWIADVNGYHSCTWMWGPPDPGSACADTTQTPPADPSYIMLILGQS